MGPVTAQNKYFYDYQKFFKLRLAVNYLFKYTFKKSMSTSCLVTIVEVSPSLKSNGHA